MKLSLGSVLVALVVFTSVTMMMTGCTSSSDPAPSEEEPSESTEEMIGSCRYPRRYAAILTDGECASVRGARGEWVPSPAFEGEQSSGACIYSWVADKKGVRIDRGAIQNWVGDRGVLTAMCGTDNGLDPAHVQQIPQLSIYGMAGSVGCDVCGLLRNNKIWIVIPPERDTHREFQVPLTNGTMRSFSIQANQNASVMSIALPPPPPGVQYVNGRVAIQ